jgi:mannose-6-phosphate isomerase-like protein (cupin superfamily)
VKYLFPFDEARTINKFGVDISIFGTNVETANFVYEATEVGHLEEFMSAKSTFMWFVIEGNGTFVIDDEQIRVKPKDVIVVPPGKRIHYFGKLKMLLCTTPAFNPADEKHIRDVRPSESPYFSES